MDPAVSMVSVLAFAVLGFLVWERLAPSAFRARATYVALVVLASAFCFSSSLLAFFSTGMGEMRPPSRLEYIAGGGFLGLMALSLLRDRMWRSRSSPDVPLSLLAACGGMLALWSSNLMGLGVGVGLYGVAQWAREKGRKEAGDAIKAVLAPLSVLLGAGFLYQGAATFEMATLGRFLWQHGGPHPFGLYFGLGLIVGGVAFSTGFIPPFAFDKAGDSPVSHLLGLMVLLRLGLYLGALARECFWLCLFLSLICFLWGWVTVLVHARRHPLKSLGGLLTAQRGFLLLALALLFRGQGMEILVTVVTGYVLVQGVSRLSLRWLSSVGGIAPGQLLSSAVMDTPLVGVPLCIGLLSLTGLPPTLGFIVRAELVRLAWGLDLTWLVPWMVAMSILCLWRLTPLVPPLLRGERGSIESSSSWPMRAALVLAAALLVVLGLFPLPLVRLAGWLVGG